MKTMKQAKDLAQSLIDSYCGGDADESTTDLLLNVAGERCQMLDNVVHMRWFRDEVADYITSHEGVKS